MGLNQTFPLLFLFLPCNSCSLYLCSLPFSIVAPPSLLSSFFLLATIAAATACSLICPRWLSSLSSLYSCFLSHPRCSLCRGLLLMAFLPRLLLTLSSILVRSLCSPLAVLVFSLIIDALFVVAFFSLLSSPCSSAPIDVGSLDLQMRYGLLCVFFLCRSNFCYVVWYNTDFFVYVFTKSALLFYSLFVFFFLFFYVNTVLIFCVGRG